MISSRIIIVVSFFMARLSLHAQEISQHSWAVSVAGSLLRPSGNPNDLNNHPLSLQLKYGYFVRPGLAVGLELQSITFNGPDNSFGSLQAPGSTFTRSGTIQDRFISTGIFADGYRRISKHLFLAAGGFIHYLYNSYRSEGEYTSGGVPAGIGYSSRIFKGYYGRAGAAVSAVFLINPQLALSFRAIELDFDMRRNYSNSYLALPVLFGIQFHLPAKSGVNNGGYSSTQLRR